MSNKAYDRLKTIALVVVPFIALLSTLCNIWEVPNADRITASLVAVDTLLGALVKILSDNYNKKKEEQLEQAKQLNGQENGNGE